MNPVCEKPTGFVKHIKSVGNVCCALTKAVVSVGKCGLGLGLSLTFEATLVAVKLVKGGITLALGLPTVPFTLVGAVTYLNLDNDRHRSVDFLVVPCAVVVGFQAASVVADFVTLGPLRDKVTPVVRRACNYLIFG
ncbi:hypothetical protein [Candidatus Regiella endosymbiont of Tuberolachnus salignus]|uniref:hypothetical protein n=1 Tax=Candidatus Regiella endosymbiont of Tuberolachnus salignus TaxID=3077956 RepID=UPI0030CED5A0